MKLMCDTALNLLSQHSAPTPGPTRPPRPRCRIRSALRLRPSVEVPHGRATTTLRPRGQERPRLAQGAPLLPAHAPLRAPTTSTPGGAAPISAAAASMPMTSPPPKYRSSAPLISGVRVLLRNMAASRIAALARGRAARNVARDARSFSLDVLSALPGARALN